MRAIDALREVRGLRVPDNVMVVGFDDIPAASWASVDLTTFKQEGARMVDEALAIVTAAEAGNPLGTDAVVIPARLIDRGSTRGDDR